MPSPSGKLNMNANSHNLVIVRSASSSLAISFFRRRLSSDIDAKAPGVPEKTDLFSLLSFMIAALRVSLPLLPRPIFDIDLEPSRSGLWTVPLT